MLKIPYLPLTPVLVALLISACNPGGSRLKTYQATIDSLNNQISILKKANQKIMDNKKMVADFYQELFGDKNIDAIDKYIGDTYIQHNPLAADGKEALKEILKQWFRNAPKEKVDIRHLGADGDYVYIHTRSVRGGDVYSVIDIFRLDNGKIVEHWDVIQKVPDNSVNPHPMF